MSACLRLCLHVKVRTLLRMGLRGAALACLEIARAAEKSEKHIETERYRHTQRVTARDRERQRERQREREREGGERGRREREEREGGERGSREREEREGGERGRREREAKKTTSVPQCPYVWLCM